MPHIDLSSLHALEIKTLRAFESDREVTLSDGVLAEATGLGAGQVRRAVEWLISKSLMEVANESNDTSVALTDIGKIQFARVFLARFYHRVVQTSVAHHHILHDR